MPYLTAREIAHRRRAHLVLVQPQPPPAEDVGLAVAGMLDQIAQASLRLADEIDAFIAAAYRHLALIRQEKHTPPEPPDAA